MLTWLTSHLDLVLKYGAYLIALIILIRFFKKGSFTVKENEIGILKKHFTLNPFRASLPMGNQVAPNGEPGYQANVLSPGWRWRLPFMYSMQKAPVVVIKHGEIGLIHALEGKHKEEGRNFPNVVECNKYQDARAFLNNGGCKGAQLDVLTEGKWFINPKLFTVTIHKSTVVNDGFIGIVNTKDGKKLEGAIAGSVISGHNKFTNANAFIKNGGQMGLQEEFLDEGVYEINPLFATVKIVPVVQIDAGTVGVKFAKFGKEPENEGADDLVEEGYKGVQRKIYREGKHKINTEIFEIIPVPIHQITLEWNDEDKKDKGRYDAGLKSIEFKSVDKYSFKIPLIQTIRIKPESAPLLIKRMGISPDEARETENVALSDAGLPTAKKRYGAIKLFVYRFLEPEVTATFNDILPRFEALDFFEQHKTIQTNASDLIEDKLSFFGVDAISTIMSSIEYPQELMTRVRAKHQLLNIKDESEKDVKEKEHELYLAKRNAEIKAIKDESERKAKELEIAGYGGIENYLKYKEMEFNKDKDNPTVYAPGLGGGYNSGSDILGLNNKVIESLNIGTSTTTHQNLIVDENRMKKKVLGNKRKKRNSDDYDEIVSDDE